MSRLKLLGGICASALLSLAFAGSAWADFTVNGLGNAADLNDPAGPADGICDANPGIPVECTLRAAIYEANNAAGHDTITFSVSGVHNVGQLNANEQVTIDGNGNGPGPADTLIEGDNTVRVFLFNHGTGVGAGTVTLKDMQIEDGRVTDPLGDGGAGIRTSGDLALSNVTVTSNDIGGDGGGAGGGILGTDPAADISLTDSTVSDNEINGNGNSNGGGISSSGPLTLTHSVISGNDILGGGTAAQGGGVHASAAYDIDSSTVINNTVAGPVAQGGGVFNGANPGVREIVNSTISGNTAPATGGGGAHLNFATTVTNVTFKNNSGGSGALGEGDDLEQQFGVATVRNSIFASVAPCTAGGLGSIVPAVPGHNIDAGTSCGFDDTDGNMKNTDPLLTGLTPFAGGHMIHVPLANSPAIDNADPGCGGGLTTDQRGAARPQGGVGSATSARMSATTARSTPPRPAPVPGRSPRRASAAPATAPTASPTARRSSSPPPPRRARTWAPGAPATAPPGSSAPSTSRAATASSRPTSRSSPRRRRPAATRRRRRSARRGRSASRASAGRRRRRASSRLTAPRGRDLESGR